jgi:hypothetical protein
MRKIPNALVADGMIRPAKLLTQPRSKTSAYSGT